VGAGGNSRAKQSNKSVIKDIMMAK